MAFIRRPAATAAAICCEPPLRAHVGASLPDPYLIGDGLVQCSCATASVHADPSCSNISQVSASLPELDPVDLHARSDARFAGIWISPLKRKAEPRAVALEGVIVHNEAELWAKVGDGMTG